MEKPKFKVTKLKKPLSQSLESFKAPPDLDDALRALKYLKDTLWDEFVESCMTIDETLNKIEARFVQLDAVVGKVLGETEEAETVFLEVLKEQSLFEAIDVAFEDFEEELESNVSTTVPEITEA